MNTATEITRHDIQADHRFLLAQAVRLGYADATDIMCLGANHGGDVQAVLAEIDGWADADRHVNPGRRSAWIKLRDAARAKVAA